MFALSHVSRVVVGGERIDVICANFFRHTADLELRVISGMLSCRTECT